MNILYCSGCAKSWRKKDATDFDTPEKMQKLAEATKKFPDNPTYGACPECGCPLFAYINVFAPGDTGVPADTSVDAISYERLEKDQATVLRYLLHLRQIGLLGAPRFQMMEDLNQTYGAVTKSLSLLMRGGLAARTVIRVENPNTGKRNCVYAACPEVLAAIKDGIFMDEFLQIRETNYKLKVELRRLCSLEELRNNSIEVLRRKCYERYAGGTL